MSKRLGGGKVYFVLYLAVLLELLIIIVERDEAEDRLLKREREAREIIQDILGQMQVGPGNENLTSRINDEISLVSDEATRISGIPYKRHRAYNIEVGVNDGGSAHLGATPEDTLRHTALLRRLTNAQSLEYELLYTPSEDVEAPEYDSANKGKWQSFGAMKLTLDTAAMQRADEWKNPKYTTSFSSKASQDLFRSCTPNIPEAAQTLHYNAAETDRYAAQNGERFVKRVFTAHFEPRSAGWYKLRFKSSANRIMGVNGEAAKFDEISDDAKINIGSMQLTVKKIRKVQKLLQRELESFGAPQMDELVAAKTDEQSKMFFQRIEQAKERVRKEKAAAVAEDIVRRLDVYADMAKLIAPNKSHLFAQNSGAMEINVRVTKPPVAIVKANVALPNLVYVFDKIPASFHLSAGPYYGGNIPRGEIVGADGKAMPLAIEVSKSQGAVADASGKSAQPLNAEKFEKGKSIEFTARAANVLPAGEYTIRVRHSSQGDETLEETKLRVFPSQLTKRSAGIFDAKMKSLYYGSTLALTLEPDSEGVIPASEFRLTMGTSSKTPETFTGLTGKTPIDARAKTAFAQLTWISPFSGEEVEIAPKKEQTISQREPDIDLSRASVGSTEGDWEELTLHIGGIIIYPATIDAGSAVGSQSDLVNLSLQASLESGDDVEIAKSDLISTGLDSYEAKVVVRSKLDKQPAEMSGRIKINVGAAMRNPVNGAVSKASAMETDVPFRYVSPPQKGAKKAKKKEKAKQNDDE
jgi:hypothetical protein